MSLRLPFAEGASSEAPSIVGARLRMIDLAIHQGHCGTATGNPRPRNKLSL